MHSAEHARVGAAAVAIEQSENVVHQAKASISEDVRLVPREEGVQWRAGGKI
ncbi:MAG TPA: hypothetical protein VGU20_07390 [Stellaceae bacterium]|nr:hypothetical protein [Stellaceae bacterium]